jgi:sulfite reductase (NADPH) hemoprotein beta-component
MSRDVLQPQIPEEIPSPASKPPSPESRSFSKAADIDEFIATVERFEKGEMTPDAFRAYRLVRGVYGQRQEDVQMLRIKIPGGVLLPDQIDALADVAEKTPRGVGHVTTRQNMQFHFVKMAEVEGHLRHLDRVGLTTRGACGNSVRNVTGCAKAGLCPDEAFDTTPFGDAITRHFLRRPIAENLPRKFKIALSGCAHDCALAAINDIGLIAHRAPDGSRRFKVLAGGGLSTMPVSGFVLHDSYPAEHICEVAEALAILFDRTGNRQNRGKARMKFVVRKLGQAEFVRQYHEELDKVIAARAFAPLEIPDHPERVEEWTLPPFASAELKAFARTNVSKTIHRGRVFMAVKLHVGDATAAQLRGLARIARRHGDHTVRLDVTQNLLLRDVAVAEVPAVFAELKSLGLATKDVGTSADVTSCPGADSCKLAITTSKDLAMQLTTELRSAPVDGVSIKMSGCPNSCGQHHIGTIGFHGAVRKIGNRAAPHYNVMVGGGVDEDGARFGKIAGKVPARRVRETIDRLIALAQENKREDESIADWLSRAEQSVLKAAIFDLTELGDRATEEDFVDIGTTAPFRVVEMEGECAA